MSRPSAMSYPIGLASASLTIGRGANRRPDSFDKPEKRVGFDQMPYSGLISSRSSKSKIELKMFPGIEKQRVAIKLLQSIFEFGMKSI
jgi:hypothetical protein